MKLITWLQRKEMPIQEFARLINKDDSLVHKYLYEEVIPRIYPMRRIYLVTDGSVDANGFFGLSDQIFEEELAKRQKIIIPDYKIDFRY